MRRSGDSKGGIIVGISYILKKDGNSYFMARVTEHGRVLKTKTFSVGERRSTDQAYEEAVSAARELAKHHGVTPKISSKDKLFSRMAERKPKTVPVKPQHFTEAGNSLIDKFGHLGQFRALIKAAIKSHGPDKVKEVLESGLSITQEALDNQAKERKILDQTYRQMAEAILNARKSGVSIPAPGPEVEDWLTRLESQANRQQDRTRDIHQFGYMLDGEYWDGRGHMPASFVRWLKEDEARELGDIAIRTPMAAAS